jgi:type ISP restriction-modification system protein
VPNVKPALLTRQGPTIPANGAIPGPPEPLPDSMDYEPATHRLRIGKGFIDTVPQAVWNYEVSGKNVELQFGPFAVAQLRLLAELQP